MRIPMPTACPGRHSKLASEPSDPPLASARLASESALPDVAGSAGAPLSPEPQL